MKNILFAISTVMIVLVITMCENNTDKDIVSGKLTFLKTNSGGCNIGEPTDLKGTSDEQFDTVIFTVNHDTLDVHIGLNYPCCATFLSDATVSNDSITITLSDSCALLDQNCFCHCECYYTWDFLFTGIVKKDYYYKVELHDVWEHTPLVFREGALFID